MILSKLEALINAFPDDDPLQPPSQLFEFCRHYSRGMEPLILGVSLLTALLAGLEVYLFSFMGQLVDLLASTEPATFFAEHESLLWGMGAVVLLLLPLLAFAHSALLHQGLLGNFPMSIRWLAHRYLLSQSMAFFEDEFAGRLATKVMQTALAVRESVMKLLDVLVYILVYFISILVLVAQMDSRLLIPLLSWLLAYIGLQLYFLPRLKRISTQQAHSRAAMTGRIVDSYSNIATVKLFAHTRLEASFAQQSMREFMSSVYRQMRLATGISTGIHLINYLLIFTITALSIYLWAQGQLSVGAIAIAIALVLRLSSMSQWIVWEVSALFENIGTMADGRNTLARARAVEDKPQAVPLEIKHGAINFQGIVFHYAKAKPLFEGFDLHIKAGEKIGLVGRSGSGKTSLVNLLLRFYDLQAGRICIDGQDISQVQQESLRAQIAMVTQDTSLLHRSVRDNILYGREDASEEEMIRAAVQAEADEFIQDLSDLEGNKAYAAQVGERGVKLSGGQRQRIALARTLLKDAPILILDEATSALDSEVEAAIQQSLAKLMHDKTVIAIAHRLSTIAALDRLIVLDRGRIVEQGSHAELVAADGIYAQLWRHQTGGFLGTD